MNGDVAPTRQAPDADSGSLVTPPGAERPEVAPQSGSADPSPLANAYPGAGDADALARLRADLAKERAHNAVLLRALNRHQAEHNARINRRWWQRKTS